MQRKDWDRDKTEVLKESIKLNIEEFRNRMLQIS